MIQWVKLLSIRWVRNSLIALIAALIFYASCLKMISPGYVGVVVDLFGDKKGVEDEAA